MKLKNKIVALFLTVACAFGLAVAGNAQRVDAANFGVTIENADVVATFDFGANGNAAHVDGNDLGASKSYTVDGYTLALSGMSKVYGPAYDAKGNSAIKLGTSSKTATLTFTVADDVNYVAIYAAKYKAKTSKVSVNGAAAITLSSSSDNGEYDVIALDTSSTKTITFATVSGGVRCMINTIEFYKATGTIVEKTDAEKVAIAAENLSLDYTTVKSNIVLPTKGDYDAVITWESDDAEIIAIDGTVTRPTTNTIVTLTATIRVGDEVATKEFDITVKGINRTIVKDPVVGKSYKMLLEQETTNKVLYLTGEMSGNYYYATTEDASKAALVSVEEATGGYHLVATVDGVSKYMNVVVESKANLSFSTTATSVWTFDSVSNTFFTKATDNNRYFIGTYSTYNTFSACGDWYLSSNYAAQLVELTEAELEELNALKVKVGYQVGTKDEAKALRLVAEFNLTAEDLETFESTIAFRVTKGGVADERVVTTLYSSVNPMNDEAELTGAYYAVLTYVNVPAGEYTVEVLVDGEVAATVVATVA